MATDCAFCRIVAGEAPAEQVWGGPGALGIVPLNPVTEGHVIFLAREHVIDAEHRPEVTAVVCRDAADYASRFVGSCNIITSVGWQATQTVFHLHVHVVPRRDGDGLKLPWTGQGGQSEVTE